MWRRFTRESHPSNGKSPTDVPRWILVAWTKEPLLARIHEDRKRVVVPLGDAAHGTNRYEKWITFGPTLKIWHLQILRLKFKVSWSCRMWSFQSYLFICKRKLDPKLSIRWLVPGPVLIYPSCQAYVSSGILWMDIQTWGRTLSPLISTIWIS